MRLLIEIVVENEEKEAVLVDNPLVTSVSNVKGQVTGQGIVKKEELKEADLEIEIKIEERVDASSAKRRVIWPETAKKIVPKVVEVGVVEEGDIPDLAALGREIDIEAEETEAILREAEKIEDILKIEETEAIHGTEEIEIEVQEEDLDLIVQGTSNHQNHMIVEIAIT